VFGDPVLRQRAAEVTEFDGALRRLADDMLQTMYDAPGVGLAAPQIGIQKRLFVFDIGEGPGAVVNPVLEEVSGEYTHDEGCLSVPGLYWPITRSLHARVRGQDLDGGPIELGGEELMARMLQHEIDHLDGKLLLTRLTDEQRKEAMKVLRENPPQRL
jgi:peptide deformylase